MKADSLQNMAVVSTENPIDAFIQELRNLRAKRRKAPGRGSSPEILKHLIFQLKALRTATDRGVDSKEEQET